MINHSNVSETELIVRFCRFLCSVSTVSATEISLILGLVEMPAAAPSKARNLRGALAIALEVLRGIIIKSSSYG